MNTFKNYKEMKTKNIKIQKALTQKRLSHVEKMRKRYEYNQAYILKITQMSTDEYFNLVLETGLELLDRIYPSTDIRFAKYYKQLAYNQNSGFWNWFKSEFAIAENDYLMNINNPGPTTYFDFIKGLPQERMFEQQLARLIFKNHIHVEI